ncbi:MAG: LptF/LptG family permease [Devosiaceae bacterium]|nr:LptF/LptG family permease [Devosiaceae bacterium]
MTLIDWHILKRLASKIALVVLIFYGLIGLTESLDTWRFTLLSQAQGQSVAIMAILASAAKWSIKVLPITVLIGSIIAILDLQAHRELIIIKSNKISIWRILFAPIIFLIIISYSVSIFLDAKVTQINRSIMPTPLTTTPTIGKDKQVWLVQYSQDKRYIVQGRRAGSKVNILQNVTVFFAANNEYNRIIAESAILSDKVWKLSGVLLFSANKQPIKIKNYNIETKSTVSELVLKLSSTDDFTFFELKNSLIFGISDPLAQAAAATRYAKLMAFPFLLVGSLLIAFAFSSNYKRNGSYASAILTGIVLGFVVFVLTEMADRAGASGILNPLVAGWGPSIIAIVIGITILLYKEDGFA